MKVVVAEQSTQLKRFSTVGELTHQLRQKGFKPLPENPQDWLKKKEEEANALSENWRIAFYVCLFAFFCVAFAQFWLVPEMPPGWRWLYPVLVSGLAGLWWQWHTNRLRWERRPVDHKEWEGVPLPPENKYWLYELAENQGGKLERLRLPAGRKQKRELAALRLQLESDFGELLDVLVHNWTPEAAQGYSYEGTV